MRPYYKRIRKNHKLRIAHIRLIQVTAIIIGIIVICVLFLGKEMFEKKSYHKMPDELLDRYMSFIEKRDYEKMYDMIAEKESGNLTKDYFVKRNSDIYEGIEASNVAVDIIEFDKKTETVTFVISFDTIAGNIIFENKASFIKIKDKYKLLWDDSLIFPELNSSDKVRVSKIKARRGEILDRDGNMLAGEGTATMVGLVPKEIKDSDADILKIAELLETDKKAIKEKLGQEWVNEDSFVPIKALPKVKEADLMTLQPDEMLLEEKKRQEELLAIPGVMFSDTQVREYPLGEAAAHLIGYVQDVTSDDLKEHSGEGYTNDSVIGRSGVESLFEENLRGQDGYRIYIVASDGREKEKLAFKMAKHGENVQLTIDSKLQTQLYEQFKNDKSCSVAMNQYTGEVLALVSTPSYNNNDFIMGLSDEKWSLLNNDKNRPMYNRFRQAWCPGSAFKPVIAAVGLEKGALDPFKDYGNEGLKWQKDSSWGSYFVTTLHTYEPVTLENALIYSDNIYFAKAALTIGKNELENSLESLWFNKRIPFEINMEQSQFSNTGSIETEIQLADSGYGQGQILVNPLHMACIYSAFCNRGNIIKPYLLYKRTPDVKYWMEEAFCDETVNYVLKGMKGVVNNPYGTGYEAYFDDIALAGKTGTAEIKKSGDDKSGTELGWFCVFTTEKAQEKPILIISMTEDVKGRGGSGYVVKKDREVINNWFYGK
ncbi:MAG: penicillin-binding transpeptidase domain-containing protein [Lachnospira sp.]